MNRLTYKNVFSKYETSFSHKLSQKAYSTYKSARLFFSKRYPLKDHERFMLEDHYLQSDEKVSPMPQGFDCSTQQETEGRIELKYVDFFDYLPKEDVETFKKSLRKFALSNIVPKFSSFRTREDENRMDKMGRYIDGSAFSNLHDIAFSHNQYLGKYAPQINVSIYNLSATFLAVKYRVYISDAFNAELQAIYRGEYHPSSDVSRQFNTPWYKPWRFGKSMYSGNDARYKAIYEKMAKLKWTIYKELKKYMKVYFSEDGVFPPTFTTYHTNIKPSLDRAQLDFWYSIGLDHNPDYSQPFNLCVGWDEKIGENEGMRLSAFCGGDYKSGDHLPDIAEYDCSMIYCVYMVASTIRRIVERDIAICNKKISRAIRKSGSTKLLKVRAAVEKNLYYGYRFMSEFSGESIDMGDVTSFQNSLIKDGSLTKSCLSGIADRILETKRQIDTILHLLNDSAEFQTEKSNMALQWFMMIVTVLSLAVAVIALTEFHINLHDFWIRITEFFKNLF